MPVPGRFLVGIPGGPNRAPRLRLRPGPGTLARLRAARIRAEDRGARIPRERARTFERAWPMPTRKRAAGSMEFRDLHHEVCNARRARVHSTVRLVRHRHTKVPANG